MFLIGQNVLGSGFAGLAGFEYGFAGIAKTIQPSYTYPKFREKDTKQSSVSDIEDTLKRKRLLTKVDW